ncbi:energy-coupling factor ABC transporter ATP-binding protein [Tessaracoccus sp. OH4464_COT-324]|uniref:energy-coupling factor ABC transporter ATP-binding protein n=1 Tax=Tessaracoccus sp. OH4464_COT-324 TaxID=2491059 RepID=UPI000F63DC1F|nr:ABC transporter ATP-binding protein [Tessaracoccus sp. OH4464_COT-324]RRD47699.1 ABC transporter ATP-binding protein [Tessaracoccus sp. OH4464_COT-324]
MIVLDRVSVAIPPLRKGDQEKVLLHDISIELRERRIAVVGANGSGKSTLLRLLNGLRAPSAGKVTVQGHHTVEENKLVRKLVGFVFTDPLSQLLMSTPVEDVELSLRATIRGKAERLRRAQELLAARGIGDIAHQSIYDLSGGERQLVALTSVLAVEPKVLVADEPTTLLDLRNRSQLKKVFAELEQQVIFSTHDLDFATLADRVLVVEGGRIVADDEPRVALDHYRNLMA